MMLYQAVADLWFKLVGSTAGPRAIDKAFLAAIVILVVAILAIETPSRTRRT